MVPVPEKLVAFRLTTPAEASSGPKAKAPTVPEATPEGSTLDSEPGLKLASKMATSAGAPATTVSGMPVVALVSALPRLSKLPSVSWSSLQK